MTTPNEPSVFCLLHLWPRLSDFNINILGKFHRAVFEVKKTVARFINRGDPTKDGKTLQERLTDLKSILIIAAKAGRFAFSRSTLGKLLYILIKVLVAYFILIQDSCCR